MFAHYFVHYVLHLASLNCCDYCDGDELTMNADCERTHSCARIFANEIDAIAAVGESPLAISDSNCSPNKLLAR